MSELDDLFEKLKAKASTLETSVISNDRWKSSRLWMAIGGLVIMIILYRMGIADKIIDYSVLIVLVLIISRSLTDIVVNICNTVLGASKNKWYALMEIERIKSGKDDGAPEKVKDPTLS